jgi:hypothetical protein
VETRGKTRDAEKERCYVCNKYENVVHILLTCNETQKWREYLPDNKLLHIDEETAYKKMISCNKLIELTRWTMCV